MKYALARAALLLVALGGAGMTVRALAYPVVKFEPPTRAAMARPTAVALVPELDATGLRTAIARPVFRADRRSSNSRYDPERASMPEVPKDPPMPKPVLAISGIVLGDTPAAVLEGVPGTERPVVLRPGESAGRLTVVRIERGIVVIQGMDTTWRLTVRQPWR